MEQETYEVVIYRIEHRKQTFKVKATDVITAKSEALTLAKAAIWDNAPRMLVEYDWEDD